MKLEHRIYFQYQNKDVQEPIISREVPFVPRKTDKINVNGQDYYVLDTEIQYGHVSHYEFSMTVIITIHLEKAMK